MGKNKATDWPVLSLRLPLPPTVNHAWQRTRTGQVLTEEHRAFRIMVLYRVREEARRRRIPIRQMKGFCSRLELPLETFRVEMTIFPANNRRQDIDNRIKATLDALTLAGVWKDDSQVRELEVTMGKPVKGGEVQLEIGRLKKT